MSHEINIQMLVSERPQVVKTKLMAWFIDTKASHNLTQVETANIVGCSQARVSDIVVGKKENFTIEWLMNACSKLQRYKIEQAVE